MQKDSSIYVAGGATLIGAGIVRQLRAAGFQNVSGGEGDPDLRDPGAVDSFIDLHRPQYVFHAAGRCGGIAANVKYPADLAADNLLAAVNVMESSHRHGVKRLMYLGRSCCYPRECPQPMRPEHLWQGPLEPTNEAYAAAKLAGIALCQSYRRQYKDDYIVAIPANVFGPGDDFSPEESHVIPGLIRRFHEAKQAGAPSVTVWGTGKARREFIYVDDLADACIVAMQKYSDVEPINLAACTDVSIGDLAGMIARALEYSGRLEFDTSKPDGMPRKQLDGERIMSLGWRPRFTLPEALKRTCDWFVHAVGNPAAVV